MKSSDRDPSRPEFAVQRPGKLLTALSAPLRTDLSIARSMARVVMTPTGRPIRSVLTGRRRLVTGSYASKKAQRPMPHESMIEHAFFMHSEVDIDVVDYLAQPLRFEFVLDGKPRSYIPDCARLLSSGQVEIVELKADWRALKDDDYRAKLEAVREICSHIGWDLRFEFGTRLRERSVLNANVRDIQSRRFVGYTAADVWTVAEGARRHETLGELAALLGDLRVGLAKLKAMIVGRLVSLPLDRAIRLDTPVKWLRPASTVEVA